MTTTHTTGTTPAPAKKRLTTSAMIASFADPGQRTTPAPFGHALAAPQLGRAVEVALRLREVVGLREHAGDLGELALLAPDLQLEVGVAGGERGAVVSVGHALPDSARGGRLQPFTCAGGRERLHA